jgi:hypothetical protein
MNIALWVLQVLLGVFFVFHSFVMLRPSPRGIKYILEMPAGLRLFSGIAVGTRTAQRFEKLVADGTADDELLVRMTLSRRGVDDPLRAMYEAQVLPKVLAELSEVAEWNEMPEAAATPALEQSLAHHPRDRAIRSTVVRDL